MQRELTHANLTLACVNSRRRILVFSVGNEQMSWVKGRIQKTETD